jgi:hypothetical protein
MNTSNSTLDLRKMSPEELERLGQQSLGEHLRAQAIVAHHKYGPLAGDDLERFLQDPECLRYPVRLVFEFGEMAMHQFAQPDIDWRNTEKDGRVLYVRPVLRQHPEFLPLAVAYMAPSINYGEIITDRHSLLYGATLLGMMEEEYYQKLCAVSDFVGAEVRMRQDERD